MRKDHYLGLLGKEPVAIRLTWSDAAEEACFPMLAQQNSRLLVQRRGQPKGTKEVPPYAEARGVKQTMLDLTMAATLTHYLRTKIPPDALQDILGHAKPESLHVSVIKLDDTRTNITETTIAVAYPPEQPKGTGRQVNLVL